MLIKQSNMIAFLISTDEENAPKGVLNWNIPQLSNLSLRYTQKIKS